MPVSAEVDAWLARVRHDLVKRMVWPARDRRDLGGAPSPGELRARLCDDEGRPVAAGVLWAALRAEAPAGVRAAVVVAGFERALSAAEAAADAGEMAGVLALEPAFDELARLARSVKGDG